jgi:hypothetical protein
MCNQIAQHLKQHELRYRDFARTLTLARRGDLDRLADQLGDTRRRRRGRLSTARPADGNGSRFRSPSSIDRRLFPYGHFAQFKFALDFIVYQSNSTAASAGIFSQAFRLPSTIRPSTTPPRVRNRLIRMRRPSGKSM